MSVDTTRTEDTIGEYRFVRILLQGQNSTVMEVVHNQSGKRFALKELLPSKSKIPEERRAFEFEAKLGADLRHPNLIRVHEYVKSKKQPYFVMDYFPSTHMRLMLGKREFYEQIKPRLRRIIIQAASGLAYLHDKGWVHRDVKPENIIVNKTGEVRVIDYALARKAMTGLGRIFGGKPPCQGTHSYMSPDQILRYPTSVSADIYSFGITCYEFACGRQPFRADSPQELLRKHIREQPSPPTVFNRDITPEYADLVMKMIRKKPKDRPKNLHEFLSLFSRVRIYKSDPDPMHETAGL
jgi:serine/threonine protein kinase